MSGAQGPSRLVQTKGYTTTMAISIMRHLLFMQNVLRRGDGLHQVPDSRRTERLLGEQGRTKLLSSGIKLEKLGAEYNPREDTCVKAFVRMLAERALAAASVSDD